MRGPAILGVAFAAAFAIIGGAASLQGTQESCSLTTPELEKALDAVHAARDGTPAESESVVENWLRRTTQMLSSESKMPKEWLHLAVDLGRELGRLGRTDQARRLFSRVAELDAKGEWGRKAAARIKDLEGNP